jgi:NAD(P)-dependent dehydrogenase (short-subunit alcohol dehydrogenase family)
MTSQEPSDFWIITGAASGIGAAVTRAVAQAGSKVLALDINTELGQQLAAETGAIYRDCDISDPEAWDSLIEYLDVNKSVLGTPTKIHLNAGIQIAPPDAPMSEYQFQAMTLDGYRRMMGVNVDGVVFGLQALLPRVASGAAIVVTASLAGVTPYSVDPLYAMSKHAVVGLVRSLGPTLSKRGITIHAFCPGGIDTAIIPHEQRSKDVFFMRPEHIATEILGLMNETETGKSWAKVSEQKPRFIIRAPGDKTK